MDALFTGKGPLAGLTGLAPADKNSQGGIFGLLTTGLQQLPKEIGKASEKGTALGSAAGTAMAINKEGANFLTGGLGIDGKQLAGGLSAIAGLAGAYGSGLQAGSYGQAAMGGALSGAMGSLNLTDNGDDE